MFILHLMPHGLSQLGIPPSASQADGAAHSLEGCDHQAEGRSKWDRLYMGSKAPPPTPQNGSYVVPVHISVAKASNVITSNPEKWESTAPLWAIFTVCRTLYVSNSFNPHKNPVKEHAVF